MTIGLFVGGIVYGGMSFAYFKKQDDLNQLSNRVDFKLCDDTKCVELHNEAEVPEVIKAPLDAAYVMNNKEVNCLAKQIMQEGVRNNKIDRTAIAYATINRVKHKEYPDTICKVISYKRGVRYDMSWYGNYKKRNMKPRLKDILLARSVLSGEVANPVGKATNWYNYKLDSKKSFNYRIMMRNSSAAFKIKGSPHFYIEHR